MGVSFFHKERMKRVCNSKNFSVHEEFNLEFFQKLDWKQFTQKYLGEINQTLSVETHKSGLGEDKSKPSSFRNDPNSRTVLWRLTKTMSGFMAVFEEGLVKVLPQQRIEWLNETFLSSSTGIGYAVPFNKCDRERFVCSVL